MFMIRLSPTFSAGDYDWDIDLPQVPSVGDTVEVDEGGGAESIVYRVLARRFIVQYHKGEQLKPEQTQVLLHVEVI
ncbi:hypothetical protein [Pararhodobacter oceanensis]|uniref:hypothetical protein n=1 Tax=Pararhodobacter oceanensis TaxID=2172121 RepID=UPI003A933AE2